MAMLKPEVAIDVCTFRLGWVVRCADGVIARSVDACVRVRVWSTHKMHVMSENATILIFGDFLLPLVKFCTKESAPYAGVGEGVNSGSAGGCAQKMLI